MKLSVSARLPKERPPWRSVRIFVPVNGGSWCDTKDLVRRALHQIADRHGIPRKQTRSVSQTASGGIYGYVMVFRGSATPATRKLFKRVLVSAAMLDLAKVPARKLELP